MRSKFLEDMAVEQAKKTAIRRIQQASRKT